MFYFTCIRDCLEDYKVYKTYYGYVPNGGSDQGEELRLSPPLPVLKHGVQHKRFSL